MNPMSLYALTGEYRAAAEKLADLDLDPQTVADTLEGLSGDLEAKATNVAKFYISLDVLAAGAKQRAAEMADRAKAIQARADAVKDYLARNLEAAGKEKIENDEICLSWRKSSAVVIDGADLIPAEFIRVKPAPPPEPDKKAIADAIKAGAEIPGAHIEHRRSLTIR
jgi:hypothetical protein